MRRRGLLGLGFLLGAGCGAPTPPPGEDVALRVVVEPREAITGRPFPLAVVRTWREDLEPGAWEDRALAPLALRLEGISRRGRGGWIEETRRYRAYAFAREDVEVPAASWTAREAPGGALHTASAPPWRLAVRPALEAAAPGAPEEPEGTARDERASLLVPGLLAALLAGLLAWRRRARRPRPAPPPAPRRAEPGEGAAPRALDALARLRAGEDRSPLACAAVVVEVAEVLRAYLGEGLGVPALERTTPEVLRAVALTPSAAHADALAEVLDLADRVKFAASVVGPVAREAALERAGAFVAATSRREARA